MRISVEKGDFEKSLKREKKNKTQKQHTTHNNAFLF